MGKKSFRPQYDFQPQLTRLHWLVRRIQRGDYPSQGVLAAEWEKTTRTIQRDLDFIRNVWGLPLEYDAYKYGYYFSEKIGKFPMIPISERELVSVFIAQKALHQYRGTPFEKPLQSAFSKLVSGLQGEISVAWADLDSAISFRGIETNPGDVEILQRLGEAVRTRHEVEFKYFKPAANPRKGGLDGGEPRCVRPYHLACIANQWYLFAYDPMRQAIRKFVPGRMRDLTVTRTRFERPPNFSVDRLLAGSFGVYSGGELQEIRIRFDRAKAALIRERKWHHSQKLKELKNGELELTMKLSSFVEIVPWILSWGEHARAVAPASLVQAMREVVSKLKDVYRG